MTYEKLYIYSFKDKIYYKVEDFFTLFKDIIFKIINKNLFMIEIKNQKNILKLNEFFIYNHDLYCFVNKSYSVIVFIVGNLTEYFFILNNIDAIKKLFLDFFFLKFFYFILVKIFIKNIHIIKYIIMILFLISSFFIENKVKENTDLIKNRNLVQRKIYIGYQNILLKAKDNKFANKKEVLIKKEIKINSIINLNEINKKHKNTFKKISDRDTRYFLNLKKDLKK